MGLRVEILVGMQTLNRKSGLNTREQDGSKSACRGQGQYNLEIQTGQSVLSAIGNGQPLHVFLIQQIKLN